jgi:hypothetical protein
MKTFNKATAAVLGGAIVSVLGAFVVMDAVVLDAIQVVLVAALVYFVPNVE